MFERDFSPRSAGPILRPYAGRACSGIPQSMTRLSSPGEHSGTSTLPAPVSVNNTMGQSQRMTFTKPESVDIQRNSGVMLIVPQRILNAVPRRHEFEFRSLNGDHVVAISEGDDLGRRLCRVSHVNTVPTSKCPP